MSRMHLTAPGFLYFFSLHIYSLSHNWEESTVGPKTKERKEIMEAAADIN